MPSTVQCATCGRELDPLRAGQVAIVGGRFVYFCDSTCKQGFFARDSAGAALEGKTLAPPPAASTAPPPAITMPPSPTAASSPDRLDSAPASKAERASENEIQGEDEPPPPEAPARSVPAVVVTAIQTAVAEALPPVMAIAPAALPSPNERIEASRREPTPTAVSPVVAPRGTNPHADEESPSDPLPPSRSPESSRHAESAEDAANATPDKASGRRIKNDSPKRIPVLPALGGTLFVVTAASLFARSFVALTALLVVAAAGAIFSVVRLPRGVHRLVPFGLISAAIGPVLLIALAAVAMTFTTESRLAIGAARAAISAASALAMGLLLVTRAFAPLEAEERRFRGALEGAARLAAREGADERSASAAQIKPGERVVVGQGERVLIDGVVSSGSARVHPWLEARTTEWRKVGDAIVAGAEIVEGELIVTTTWSGEERGVIRAFRADNWRFDRGASNLERARPWILLGPLAFAILAGIFAGLSPNANWLEGALAFAATLAALPGTLACVFVSTRLAHAFESAAREGIFFRDARALEAASRVDRVALCSGAALLSGKPEVVGVEPSGAAGTDELLSLAAAATGASPHVVGEAIGRAVRARGLPTVALRTITQHPGMGVTAQAPGGERLVVGSRTLCMNESVSIARAEDRIAELEAKGRNVILVALAERLLGWIAVQDEMRPGARPTVQRLLLANVEPVLLTGAARATAESLASALTIEHVRPEVAPDERGAEVRALATSGAGIGAIGHPKYDDAALGAATVSVALGSAGAPPGEWAIALATDRPEVAALAIETARNTRDLVRMVLIAAFLPGILVALGLGASLFPVNAAWLAPLSGLAGVAAARRRACFRP